MFTQKQSAYLAKQERLADLIAAIQAMGSYRFSSRKVEKWEQILQKPRSAESWDAIFKEHPEFFRASSRANGEHQLVLRRAQNKVYDTDTGKEITVREYFTLDEKGQDKISRKPLSAEQIISLVEVAIKLQNQAITFNQEQRWRIPLLMGLLGVLLGALLKS